MPILFISGVNDQSLMGVNLDEHGKLVHLMDGNCSVQFRLPLREGVAVPFTIFGKGVRQQMPAFRAKPSVIFNQIADADTHRGALERCAELCDQIGSPVINHPRHVLATTRDQVASRLQGIPGVVMPRTLRFSPGSPDEVQRVVEAEGFEFPYILRVAGDHQGKRMIRMDRPGDHAAMHALPFDGREFYLVEYIDCQDPDGLFHKQRIIVVDGEPILRHALYLDDWIVHASSRSFVMQRETWEEDVARFDRLSRELLPQFRPAIDRITQQLNLQYYGIDCTLGEDGRMVVFEANANMNVLHSPNAASRYRVEAIQKALYGLLSKYTGEQLV